jgi:nitrite reductase/ring-hydroxylating ferredoxin subunit
MSQNRPHASAASRAKGAGARAGTSTESMSRTTRTEPELPDVRGWFCLGRSSDVRAGSVVRQRFQASEVVVARTEGGRAFLADAYCPHLGAHLGHGGVVCGEVLRCPFHHFDFDATGACVATPYGHEPPAGARLATWPCIDRDGFLLVFWDPDESLERWELPSFDHSGWSPLRHGAFRLHTHPQETTENSVDLGHLSVVHGYRSVRSLQPLELDGPRLRSRYAMRRRGLMPGTPPLDTLFAVRADGLGYSTVEVEVPRLGMQARQYVFSTPRERGEVDLYVAIEVRSTRRRPWSPLWDRLLSRFAFRALREDISHDFDIWKHKSFVHPPALARGDGPIGPYRRWAKQFHRPADPPSISSVGSSVGSNVAEAGRLAVGPQA